MSENESESESEHSGETSTAKEPKAKITRSSRAGLQFSVSRIDRLLRKGQFADRIGAGAPVYMAAVLQYLTHEIVDIAGEVAARSKKRRISPRHLQLAIHSDSELKKLLGGVTISQGGVLHLNQPVVLPSKKRNGRGAIKRRIAPASVPVK
ncbi:late histone H2A.2.2-like [Trachemys scripta elegans]|uniref:late histone H2A.2.2-like n=1 Tax=Trachemys scripta elegans TaxID=31138 RepID=UPI001556FA8D|nr:late histone H2A.2.2-like [Trachemys scripta elegans]